MKYLVDTHLLLWAAIDANGPDASSGLTPKARKILMDETNELLFSAAVIWEVAIKSALGKPNFSFDPHVFRRGLLDNGYAELPISGRHAAAVANMESHHGDPFDRIQIAQATVEGIHFLTHDPQIVKYTNSPVLLV